MAQAIEFVQRTGDDALWEQLLAHAYRSASLAEALLRLVCRAPLMQLEPLTLIRRLPEGMDVPGLKAYVQQILAQASNQLDLTGGCMRVAQGDAAALAHERHKYQRKGTVVHP